jgi:hypothetical protein
MVELCAVDILGDSRSCRLDINFWAGSNMCICDTVRQWNVAFSLMMPYKFLYIPVPDFQPHEFLTYNMNEEINHIMKCEI